MLQLPEREIVAVVCRGDSLKIDVEWVGTSMLIEPIELIELTAGSFLESLKPEHSDLDSIRTRWKVAGIQCQIATAGELLVGSFEVLIGAAEEL